MTLLSCARGDEVRAAASAGRWTASLREHAATCRHCGGVALVTTALSQPLEPRVFHGDPGVLWMQARLTRRLRAEAHISRIVTAVQTTAGIALVAALGYLGSTLTVWSRIPDPAISAAIVGGTTSALFGAVVFLTRRTRHV